MTVYTAVESFGPWRGDAWTDYVQWSGLVQLSEVVSLDGMLCPSIIRGLTEADWEHNVHADCRVHLFRDLPYLLDRVRDVVGCNILAILEKPTDRDMKAAPGDGFVFCGFDLVDLGLGNSALINCGGFARAFKNAELNRYGLLDGLDRASEVQRTLWREYPEEPHAKCHVWAIWRLEGNRRRFGG